MSKKNICLIVIFIFIISSIIPAYAETTSNSVKVTLPTFKVTINGSKMDSSYSKYPLIVYKDITYFPMTYNDCRYLGLESNWKGIEDGLLIDATDITAAYNPYNTNIKNSSSYMAMIPTFPIKINGKSIDNSKEEYPLLIFRDITYFPITWKFGVEEFGWNYSFDSKNGLVINSHNIHLLQVAIPNDMSRAFETMAIADGYVYYVGTNGRIMQAEIPSVKDDGFCDVIIASENSKVVYQLPFNSIGDGKSYVVPKLYSEEGKAYLTFYGGGATMGTDYLIHLNKDEAILINNTRNAQKSFGDKEFLWWVGSAPAPGNLYMKSADTINSAEICYEDYKKIGNEGYLYGWNWEVFGEIENNNQGQGGSGSNDCYLIDDNLYILAFDMKQSENYFENGGIKPTTGLYQLNINTNEMKRISNQEVLEFRVEGDYIYYHNKYVELFKYKISEEKEYPIEAKLSRGNNFIEQLEVLGGNIYFESGVDHGLYNSNYETLGFGVHELKLTGSNKEYVACTLSGYDNWPDRIMIFDNTGEKIFRSSDDSYALTVENNKLYYFNKNTNTICIGDLK